MRKNVTAIVPAAGLGKRLGSGTSKPFCNLLGKPLIVWTLEALEQVEEVDEVIPVVKEADMRASLTIFEQYNFSKIRRMAPGGKERQDSVFHGLKLVDGKAGTILIHDAARPLVTAEGVRKVIASLEGFDGAVAGVPVKDTIKEVEVGNRRATDERAGAPGDAAKEQAHVIKSTLRRELLWAIQTPQVFSRDFVTKAYEKAMEERFYATDDSALAERIGGRVRIVMGSYENIKITTPEDIAVAEQLLRKRSQG